MLKAESMTSLKNILQNYYVATTETPILHTPFCVCNSLILLFLILHLF